MYASPSASASSSPSIPLSVGAALAFAAATVAAAVGGSVVNQGAMDWYDGLDTPFFTPPDATFGIVWTVLYVMIGFAGWFGWRAVARFDEPVPFWSQPTVWWAIQMVLNFGWTAVFFGLQAPIGGLIVIGALIAAVITNIVVVARFHRLAAWLLVPYLAWCCFAAALNVGIAALN